MMQKFRQQTIFKKGRFKYFSSCNEKVYDSVVLGLGGAGASSLYHLSKTGRKVLGIEKFNFPHTNGSSHGDSRIIREAYFEGEYYVPFVKKSYQLWDELEKKSGKQLFLKTGLLGVESCETDCERIVEKSKKVCELHDIKYEILNNETVNKRHPFFNFPKNLEIISEVNAGVLFPEKCIEAHLSEARKNNADFLYNTEINKVTFDEKNKIYSLKSSSSPEVEIQTKTLVLSCGAWINQLLANFNIQLPLTIDLNYVYYYKYKNSNKDYGNFPIYIVSYEGDLFYGFPDLKNGNGYKISIYKQNISFKDVQLLDRTKLKEEVFNKIFRFGEKFLAGFNRENMEIIKYLTCLYTTTPDSDFIIDFIPNTNNNVILLSACSGHGFKFSSRVGEHVANLFDNKEKPINQFRLDRFLH